VLSDMTVLGLAPELLTHPPVPHPLVDPGTQPVGGALAAAQDAPATA
jgi:hypothetical protein